jgi:hypothetical protein
VNSSRPRALFRAARLRSAILGVAAIALAACSGVHPGSAAVVDGQTIAMSTVDKSSVAYCKLAVAVAAQQGTTTVATSDTRRQSIRDLITYAVAKKLVKERDLQIDPNTYVITDAQKAQIAKAFPGSDLKQINEAIERSQETYAVTLALGEAATGKTKTESTTAEIETAGQAEITKVLKASDISIDPRFGLDDVTSKVAETGSLSVAEVTDAKVDPAKLPATQRCS